MVMTGLLSVFRRISGHRVARNLAPLALAGLLGVMALPLQAPHSWAESRTTTLKQLGASEDIIHLPTVSSQREIPFKMPKSWQVSNGVLNLSFQHSSELQPHRSFMEVILNNRVLKKIALTKANAEQTTLSVPMAGLKNDNVLKIRVEQHYTDKCEDPVDASLWTNVLNDSKLTFNYAPKAVPLSLKAFPFPIVESGTWHEAQVAYVVPNTPSTEQLQAISLVQAHLGMNAKKQELVASATNSVPAVGHVVWIGLGSEVPSGLNVNGIAGARLQGGQWVNASGQALSGDDAVVALLPHGAGGATLVISANSPGGLVNGAKFLTHLGTKDQRNAASMVVNGGWQPGNTPSTPVPRYLANEARTLKQLGFGDQYVEKLYAPPIEFNIPVVTNVDKGSANGLTLDVTYSYSPGLNPRYSSLEWRLNDRAIANIPLTNTGGQERLHATIPIAAELVKPHNRLVAQFHLMPDKYGFCVDDFVDKAWGKIFTDESSISFNGSPAGRLPSAGLINSTGYPFTAPYDLANAHLVFAPKQPGTAAWNAWLGLVGRLGRISDAPAGYAFTTSLDAKATPGGKHVLVLGDVSHSGGYGSLPIRKDADTTKVEDHAQGTAVLSMADLDGIQLQQGGNNGEISLIGAANDAAYTTLAELFNRDEAFQQLLATQVVQGGKTKLNSILGFSLNGVDLSALLETAVSKAKTSAPVASHSYTPPTRDYGWLNIVVLPIQTVLDWVRGAIVWVVTLPVLSTIIGLVLGLWSPILNLPFIAGVTAWFQSHIICGFIVGSILFFVTLALLFSFIGVVIRLLTSALRK